MPTSSPSYILRPPRHGCYYFEMKVPVDLQPCVGKKGVVRFIADRVSDGRQIQVPADCG